MDIFSDGLYRPQSECAAVFQTAETQTTRACVPHTPYARSVRQRTGRVGSPSQQYVSRRQYITHKDISQRQQGRLKTVSGHWVRLVHGKPLSCQSICVFVLPANRPSEKIFQTAFTFVGAGETVQNTKYASPAASVSGGFVFRRPLPMGRCPFCRPPRPAVCTSDMAAPAPKSVQAV